jgi:hypothetical protein
VRSSGRSAKIAERALLAGTRPVLAGARSRDGSDQVQFADSRVFDVGAQRALVHQQDEVIYLAMPLRNVGAGIARLRGYHLEAESARRVSQDPRGPARHQRGEWPPDASQFAVQQRDLYIPAGELGFWQAALRDPLAAQYAEMTEAIATAGRITIDLLYGDHEGGQPTITRFVLLPDHEQRWRPDVAHHWSLP